MPGPLNLRGDCSAASCWRRRLQLPPAQRARRIPPLLQPSSDLCCQLTQERVRAQGRRHHRPPHFARVSPSRLGHRLFCLGSCSARLARKSRSGSQRCPAPCCLQDRGHGQAPVRRRPCAPCRSRYSRPRRPHYPCRRGLDRQHCCLLPDPALLQHPRQDRRQTLRLRQLRRLLPARLPPLRPHRHPDRHRRRASLPLPSPSGPTGPECQRSRQPEPRPG
jgi:hypothetical protein